MAKRTSLLPFALPELGEGELNEVTEVLKSGWLTTGPKAQQFEREFASYVGAKHAIAVNSCTAAMHLALEALGVGPGDFVVTTPYTFAATAEVIRYFDAVPVFVDVEPDTLNLDPAALTRSLEDLNRVVSGRGRARLPAVARAVAPAPEAVPSIKRPTGAAGSVKAVIPVHIAGHPCEMDVIGDIAGGHQLAVIDDAAHACGATFRGKAVGGPVAPGMPYASCFSFYATKTLATGEGGMVTTDSDQCAERVRLMSLHGISKDAWKRYTAEGHWYYEVIAPGFKYNMPDIIAALGVAQLRRVDEMQVRRHEIARRYDEAFASYPELQIPTARPHVGHAWHLYILRLNPERLSIGRNEFIDELKALNVGTSVHFIPLHTHPYYRSTYGYQPDDLPVAFGEYGRAISLPIYSKMTDFDIECVIDAVAEVVRRFRSKSYAVAGH